MPEDDADASAPAICTLTPDELDATKIFSRKPGGCSRPVWEGADAPRCVWHADGADKPSEELAAMAKDGDLTGARARKSDLTKISFPENTILQGADLSRADLSGAILTGADLRDADLSRAYFVQADLSGADLSGADLSEVDFQGTDGYHPQESEGLPFVIPVVENAVGRFVVRTRLTQPARYIPEEALSFLRSVPLNAPDGADVALEEAQTYGWGIGHPEHPTADYIHEMASEHLFWAHSSLEQAFYADQHAAVELLERLARDDPVDVSVSYVTGTAGSARFFLDCVAGPDSDEYWPQIPRYWDWHDQDAFAFEWDPEVKERIRDLVRDTGIDEELPTDWTVQNLAI